MLFRHKELTWSDQQRSEPTGVENEKWKTGVSVVEAVPKLVVTEDSPGFHSLFAYTNTLKEYYGEGFPAM